ncbi:MAG TPA: response regulator [Ramlibacter sp.]|nr:response regulator [Ramlibacter sp.]
MSLRVLLVEDDRDMRSMMQSTLAVEGFDVQTAVSVSEASALVRNCLPDVVVLDLGLPDGDGIELVEQVRRQHSLPILVVSARHQETEKIKLLDAGADDYLTKPFSVGELLARIRVALRHRGTALEPAATVHQLDDLRVDLNLRLVELAGEPVHLTPTEFKLLARLVRSAGRVVTHRQLLRDVWGAEFTEHTHYLRLYMGQLRAKIEADPAEPRYLLTETGVGYRLAAV